jgi:hypothetical protein
MINTNGRIDSPYWFEFDRDVLEYIKRDDGTYERVVVGSNRLLAQVLTLSIETQNMRLRTFDAKTKEFFGTFDMIIDEFYKNFEIYKKSSSA